MNFKRLVAASAMAATLGLMVPAAPALADGAASTRNILLGIGAATYLIIQHNRKVHERYAEDARRQAELQAENRDAWAAYSSEKNAYQNATAEIVDLKREVAFQHNVIVQQRNQLSLNARGSWQQQRVAYAPPAPRAAQARPPSNSVAMVSYGWGNL